MLPDIDTERLRLRPVGRGDEAVLCALFWHSDVVRYLSEETPARVAIREMIEASCDRSSVASFWTVSDGGPDVIGLVGVWPPSTAALALRNIGWRSLELVIAFHPDAWGKGYAREAVDPVVSHALADGVTFAVLGAVAEPNARAHKLMKSCRFEQLGRVAGPVFPIIVYERAS